MTRRRLPQEPHPRVVEFIGGPWDGKTKGLRHFPRELWMDADVKFETGDGTRAYTRTASPRYVFEDKDGHARYVYTTPVEGADPT